MKSLILLGGGGQCRSAIDVILSTQKYEIAGIVEREDSGTTSVLGYDIVGSDSNMEQLITKYRCVLVTVGQIKDPTPRIRLFELARIFGAELPVITSSHSYVSPRAELGSGSIVMHGAVVNIAVEVGVNCIINSMSLVEHDAVVGDHSHIATGVRVNGAANIGSRTFVGSGSTIHEGVVVGDDCVIAAGSVVMRDIPSGQLFRNST
jgi:sugar O-acyltransferase (sialic acid O-acetyltransferase NeuD family)